MSAKTSDERTSICSFAPDVNNAGKEDEILFEKAKTLQELNESSERCLKHVSEHLDEIEKEILAGTDRKKTD